MAPAVLFNNNYHRNFRISISIIGRDSDRLSPHIERGFDSLPLVRYVWLADRGRINMSDESDRDSKSPQSPDTPLLGQSTANDRAVEDLARELSERLREMPNRQEMTDYAVSLLKDSNEEADQADLARDSKVKAARGDPFNPIAFAIPLLVVGLVLMATGLLTGMGILVVAIAVVMFAYGLIVPFFSRSGGAGKS